MMKRSAGISLKDDDTCSEDFVKIVFNFSLFLMLSIKMFKELIFANAAVKNAI